MKVCVEEVTTNLKVFAMQTAANIEIAAEQKNLK